MSKAFNLRLFSLLLGFTLFIFPAPRATWADAVISQASPQVRLQTKLGGPRHPARSLQIVASGATLLLPDKSRVVLICEGDRALVLNGPRDWQPGSDSCQAGKAVAPGTFASMVPSRGRSQTFDGGLFEESSTRSDDRGGKVPVLVSPRAPALQVVLVGKSKPLVEWSRVHDASGYDLVLRRSGGQEQTFSVVNAQADCRQDHRISGLQICRSAWPWAPLSSGQMVELQIRAHSRRLDAVSDFSRLQLAKPSQLAAVGKKIKSLASTDLPDASRYLLEASHYAQANLFNEAAAALATSFKVERQAAVASRLADVYLDLGLLPGAITHYQTARSLLGRRSNDLEILADVHLGLGRVFNARKEAQLAKRELERAAEFYRRVGWTAEAEQAANEASFVLTGE